MKRFVGMILVLMLICSSALCEGIDFSAMSDEELQSVAMAIQQELVSRNVYTDSIFFEGIYTVGEDIEPGVYEISLFEFSRSDNEKAYIYIHDGNGETIGWEQFKSFDVVLKKKLNSGDTIEFDDGNYIAAKIG